MSDAAKSGEDTIADVGVKLSDDIQRFDRPRAHGKVALEPQVLLPKIERVFLLLSESVSEGHPGKICDGVCDAVLDVCLPADPQCKVACGIGVNDNTTTVAGEITVAGMIDDDTYPDEICDHVFHAVLGACLASDLARKVACATCVKINPVSIAIGLSNRSGA